MLSNIDVVKGALRKLGVLASGRTPRDTDRDDTFAALQGIYRQLITNGAFGRLRDVVPTTDFTAVGNVRIFRPADAAAISITLPETVNRQDYWCDHRIYGSCWCPDNTVRRDVTPPRDCSVVTISDGLTGNTYDFIYDGHTKLWQGIYDMELTDPAPLSFRDPQGLMAYLAWQVADDFSAPVGQSTLKLAQNFQSGLVTRFSMPSEQVAGVYF